MLILLILEGLLLGLRGFKLWLLAKFELQVSLKSNKWGKIKLTLEGLAVVCGMIGLTIVGDYLITAALVLAAGSLLFHSIQTLEVLFKRASG